MDQVPAKRPKVVRRVSKWTKETKTKPRRPKVARDYRTRVQVERVMASTGHMCLSRKCPFKQAIRSGVEYAQVQSPKFTGNRTSYRPFPETRKYHFECLPPEAQALRRFFDGT